MRSIPRAAVAFAFIVLGSTLAVRGQSPAQAPSPDRTQRPVFRGGVDLLQLDVSVLDRQRRPVSDLTAADFTVLEDGVERPLRAFSAVKLPARDTSAAARAGSADVVTNRIGEQEGRLVVILMDRSIPVGEPTVTARKVALAAVDALGPQDLAAVVSTSGGVPQNLTGDRERLIKAITQRDWSTGMSPDQEAIYASFVGPDDPLSDGRCLCGACVLDTVTRVADALRNAPRRRKSLLFIGSRTIMQSGPRAPTADVGCERVLRDSRDRMQASLQLSSLTVHSFDPSGVASIGPQTRAGTPNRAGAASRTAAMLSETTSHLEDQDSLAVLPDFTGGRTIRNTNAPQAKVPDVFEESGSYYVLAFEPRAGTDLRKIEVKVARPGVRVHTQRRYKEAEPVRAPVSALQVSPSLDAATFGLLPIASRPLAMSLSAFAGSEPGKALVLINVDVSAFAPSEGGTRPVDLAVRAVGQTGRQVAFARESATIVRPASAPGKPIEAVLQTRLELPPGDYEIRVGVADPAADVVASVFAPVVVPRFADAPLSLSDVMLEPAASTPGTTAGNRPTTRRRFAASDRMQALLQVYQGTQRSEAPAPVSIRTRIVDAKGQAVRDQALQIAAGSFTDRRASVSFDLSGLAPGSYELQIDASSKGRSAARRVRFAVE